MPADIAVATVRAVSAAWILHGFTVTNGQLGVGTATEANYNFVKDQSPTFPPSAASSSAAFIQIRAGNQVTAETPEITQVVSLDTGATKEGGGSSGSGDKISFTLFDTTSATIALLNSLRGKPILVCIPHGENADGNVAYYYILGEISSDLSVTFSEGTSEVSVEVTGKEYSGTGADTELAWAPTEVFPIGVQDVTPAMGNGVIPTPLVAGDLPTLKQGKIVQK